MDCVVTPLKTLMGFSVHLNVQLKFYNLPITFKFESVKRLKIKWKTFWEKATKSNDLTDETSYNYRGEPRNRG